MAPGGGVLAQRTKGVFGRATTEALAATGWSVVTPERRRFAHERPAGVVPRVASLEMHSELQPLLRSARPLVDAVHPAGPLPTMPLEVDSDERGRNP